MAQPVQADRLKARIAEQDLERPARCGIPFADDRKVGPNLIKHGLAADQTDFLAEELDRVTTEVALGAVHLGHAH